MNNRYSPSNNQPAPEVKAFNLLLSLAETEEEKKVANMVLQPLHKSRRRYAFIKKTDYDFLVKKVGKPFLAKLLFIDYKRSEGKDDYVYSANKSTLRASGLPESVVMKLTPQFEIDNQEKLRKQNEGKRGDYTIIGSFEGFKTIERNYRAGTQQINDGKTFNSQRQVPAKYRKRKEG